MAMLHTKEAMAPPMITTSIPKRACHLRQMGKVGNGLPMSLKQPPSYDHMRACQKNWGSHTTPMTMHDHQNPTFLNNTVQVRLPGGAHLNLAWLQSGGMSWVAMRQLFNAMSIIMPSKQHHWQTFHAVVKAQGTFIPPCNKPLYQSCPYHVTPDSNTQHHPCHYQARYRSGIKP